MTNKGCQVSRAFTGLVLLFAALFWSDTAAAAAPCPPGYTFHEPTGYCRPPECDDGDQTAMKCTGSCDRCSAARGGYFPGEKRQPQRLSQSWRALLLLSQTGQLRDRVRNPRKTQEIAAESLRS